MRDFTKIPNSLAGGPSVPATVSFDVHWSGVRRLDNIHDKTNGFAGQFIENMATIEWSATEEGFAFDSDPAETSTNVFSLIGHERNGVFFPQG
jgi:hypothetical protein